MGALMIDYRALIEEAIQRVEAKSFELSSIITDLSAQHDRLIAARSVLDDMDMIFGREADTSSPEPKVTAASGDDDPPVAEAPEQTVQEIDTGGHTLDQGEGQHGAQALPDETTDAPPTPGSASVIGESTVATASAALPEPLPTGKPGGDADTSSPAPLNRKTVRQRILDLHAAHPDYTQAQAIAALGVSPGAVRGYSSLLKIKWRSAREPAGGVSAPDAPSPAPAPIRPPMASPAPARPMPSGTLFRLTDGNGLYLHQSGTAMTPQVHYAWTGPADKLLAVRKKFAIARDLTEQVILKSMRAA